MEISEEEALYAMLRVNFLAFLEWSFYELNGGHRYMPNWHIEAIVHQLDRIQDGDLRRLIVTMPPRHLKSITVSTAWVAWMLGNNPATRFMCLSYGLELAEKPAADCLRLMTSDWYRKTFPDVRLTRKAVLNIETSAGGGRLTTSLGGAITGLGAEIIILDDPTKADDAMSETMRESAMNTLRNTIMQRSNDPERGVFILVMQRLHQSDLAGELIAKGGWHELRLAAIATHDELIPLRAGKFYQRRAGHALHPERQSLKFLLEKRAEDSYVFAAQFQQDPVAPIGSFVHADWFKTYDDPPRTGTVMQSWDTAVKKAVRNDWSVGITAIFYQGRYYVLDVFRARVSFSELIAEVRASCIRHKVERLLIEDASSGQQLITQLQDEPMPGVPFPKAIKPLEEKTARFEAQASKIETGCVVLPRAAPWLADFVGEVVSFPGGRFNDQADALAQLLGNPPPHWAPPTNAAPELITIDPDVIDPSHGRLSYDDDDDDPWALPD